jgi:hypothetical protein
MYTKIFPPAAEPEKMAAELIDKMNYFHVHIPFEVVDFE